MWMEELSNGKYKFFERYKDPYTEKWKRVSVTLDFWIKQGKERSPEASGRAIGRNTKEATND